MKKLLRLFLLSGCLCSFGQAAAINVSGTLEATSGIFSTFPGLNVGDPFYGSVDITSVGSDQDASSNVGLFSVVVGQLSFFTPGLGNISFLVGPTISMTVTTVHQESGDSLTIQALSGFESAAVTLNGNNGFLLSDSFPNGNGGIIWSQFIGGSAYYDSSLIPTGNIAAVAEGNTVDFVIDQASEVPEPGTILLAPAGALVLYLRRRAQVR